MTIADRIVELARRASSLTRAERGSLNALLDRHVNTASNDQMSWFLYGLRKAAAASSKARPVAERIPFPCGFKPQFKREKGHATGSTTGDVEALLNLHRQYQEWPCGHCGARTSPERVTCRACGNHRSTETLVGDRRIELCLELSALRTQLETATCRLDDDGRLRCQVLLTGTETQRHATKKTAMGTGYALHTTPEEHKRLFLADPDHWLASVDLSGADGWTIAAECAACGDTMMLDDLLAGIKPAQAVALLYLYGTDVNKWSRDEVRARIPDIKKLTWLYPATKRIIWARCYGAAEQTISTQILKESYKDEGVPLYVEPRVCKALLDLTDARYRGICWRQAKIKAELMRTGIIEAPNGSRRVFFGKRDEAKTQREAYAYSPQVMTTYFTELAWARMWYDPDNVVNGGRICQPLLLVHDSLVFQFRRDRVDFTCRKVPEWFDNPLKIAGIEVRVPYSGGWGRSWGELTEGRL